MVKSDENNSWQIRCEFKILESSLNHITVFLIFAGPTYVSYVLLTCSKDRLCCLGSFRIALFIARIIVNVVSDSKENHYV
jgi:hypothetical protein